MLGANSSSQNTQHQYIRLQRPTLDWAIFLCMCGLQKALVTSIFQAFLWLHLGMHNAGLLWWWWYDSTRSFSVIDGQFAVMYPDTIIHHILCLCCICGSCHQSCYNGCPHVFAFNRMTRPWSSSTVSNHDSSKWTHQKWCFQYWIATIYGRHSIWYLESSKINGQPALYSSK